MAAVDFALRFAHILGAILLVGGIILQRWVVRPATDQLTGDSADAVRETLRKRWTAVVMIGITLLLVSGLVNTARVSIAYRFPNGEYNPLLGIKILVALVVMFGASVLSGRSLSARKWSANRVWLDLLVLLSILVLVLAGFMRAADRVPKKASSPSTAANAGDFTSGAPFAE